MNLQKAISSFATFTILLVGIHYLLIRFVPIELHHFSLLSIYAFNVLLAVLVCVTIYIVYLKAKDQTGFAFLGMIAIKMIAAAAFLMPWLRNEIEIPQTDIYAFTIPYIFYLFYETFFAVQLLKDA